MKFEKSYRDFFNEVITEAPDTNATINKQINAVTDGLAKKFEKSLGKKYSDSQLKDLLVTYAQCFVLEYEDEWKNFMQALAHACVQKKQVFQKEKDEEKGDEDNRGIWCTKFQFMQSFFLYYFQSVFHYKKGWYLGNIKKCLKRAAETYDLEKEEYNSNAVSQAVKVVQKGNKSILVKVFNSLKGYY